MRNLVNKYAHNRSAIPVYSQKLNERHQCILEKEKESHSMSYVLLQITLRSSAVSAAALCWKT